MSGYGDQPESGPGGAPADRRWTHLADEPGGVPANGPGRHPVSEPGGAPANGRRTRPESGPGGAPADSHGTHLADEPGGVPASGPGRHPADGHGTHPADEPGAGGRRGTRRRGTGRPAAVLAAAVLALAPLLSGCGIRTTSVPVDAGPAPSRVSCAAPKASSTPGGDTVVRKVYLVCSMQIAPVARSVQVRDRRTGRWTQVRELLAQLQMSPRIAETKAGFSTAVPGTLDITPGLKTDPRDTLRLSEPHDELPSFALAQLVCTLAADPLVAPHQRVILGDPAPGKLRSYTCTPDLRTRSEAADTAGTDVP